MDRCDIFRRKSTLDYVITPLDSNGGDIPLRASALKSVNAKMQQEVTH